MERAVTRVRPIDGLVRTVSARIETLGTSIYDFVDELERVVGTFEERLEEAGERISLRGVVNLHNASGIKSLAQIAGLTQAIETHRSCGRSA